MILQLSCAVFFVADIVEDFASLPSGQLINTHISMELAANLGLIAAFFVGWRVLRPLLARQRATERALSAATGSLHRVIESYFSDWGLTPAEADVAHFTIKGFSVAEVARMRKSSDGTVKSQLNAIYRKSGLNGRAQLVSLLIEDLLQARPAVVETPADPVPAGSPLAI